MKICAPATSNPGIDLNLLDEITILYTERHTFEKLLNFCSQYSDKQINLVIKEEIPISSLCTLNRLLEETKEKDTISACIKYEADYNFSMSLKDVRHESKIVIYGIITEESLTEFVMSNYNAIVEVFKKKGILTMMSPST